jgi:hypothetical protein
MSNNLEIEAKQPNKPRADIQSLTAAHLLVLCLVFGFLFFVFCFLFFLFFFFNFVFSRYNPSMYIHTHTHPITTPINPPPTIPPMGSPSPPHCLDRYAPLSKQKKTQKPWPTPLPTPTPMYISPPP